MPPMVSSDFAKNALHGAPQSPGSFRPGAAAQTPEEATAVIIALIDQPRADIYTKPDQSEMVRHCFSDVASFEENMRR